MPSPTARPKSPGVCPAAYRRQLAINAGVEGDVERLNADIARLRSNRAKVLERVRSISPSKRVVPITRTKAAWAKMIREKKDERDAAVRKMRSQDKVKACERASGTKGGCKWISMKGAGAEYCRTKRNNTYRGSPSRRARAGHSVSPRAPARAHSVSPARSPKAHVRSPTRRPRAHAVSPKRR